MQWTRRRSPTSWDYILCVIAIGTFKQRAPQAGTDFTRASIGSPISWKMPTANRKVILSTFSCYTNTIQKKRKKKEPHTCPPIGTSKRIAKSAESLRPREPRWIEGSSLKVISALASSWGEGSGQAAANGHTGLLPRAQLIITITTTTTLALYSYTFYTEMPQERGKLGSNYIKVPNSETYDTRWLTNYYQNDTFDERHTRASREGGGGREEKQKRIEMRWTYRLS